LLVLLLLGSVKFSAVSAEAVGFSAAGTASISLREAGGWVWVSAGASGAQEAVCASTSVVVVVGGI